MRTRIVLALSIALIGFSAVPANAATKPTVVTAAFKNLLSVTSDSLDQLDQKYEAEVDALDASLLAATKAADDTYNNELASATALYTPQIAAANQKAEAAKALFNENNRIKIGAGGGFFGGTNLANYVDCLIDGKTLRKLKRYCAENIKVPVPGTGTYDGAEWPDWNAGDITTIQLFSAAEPLVQNGIAAGYIILLSPAIFDSSRIAYKQALDDVAALTAKNGNARAAAQTKKNNAVNVATSTRASKLAEIDDAYQTAKANLEAQQEAASLALLAAKRATKDAANFDKAFTVAYKFEYNKKMVDQIADAAWTGDWTYRTIDSILKVNKLAVYGDGIANKYSMSSASAFNSAVGNAFTNEPEFRAALKVLTATYKKTTNSTLKF
jgi:hypothetical protein